MCIYNLRKANGFLWAAASQTFRRSSCPPTPPAAAKGELGFATSAKKAVDRQPAGTARPAPPPRRVLRRAASFALQCTEAFFLHQDVSFNYKGSETFDWGSNADSANPRTVWLLASHSITLNMLLSVKTNSHLHLTGLSRHRRRKDESTQPHGARRVAAAGYTARTNRSVRVGGLLTPLGFRLATFQTTSPRAPTLCAQQSCSSHSSSRARLSADRSVRMSYKRALEEEAGARQALSEAGRQQGWHSLLGQTAET